MTTVIELRRLYFNFTWREFFGKKSHHMIITPTCKMVESLYHGILLGYRDDDDDDDDDDCDDNVFPPPITRLL